MRLKLIAGMDFQIGHFWQWNIISVDKISCKHYPKRNAYACLSKYRVVLKCSWNKRSFEQNLFSRQFEISNRSSFHLSCERNLHDYTLFYIRNTFISNAKLKLTKNQTKAKPEAELFLFENYSLSLSTFSY